MRHEFESYKISIYEPFADFLMGTEEEKHFDLTLLDVVRFAGHACPSMVGAFLVSQRVIREFYPETKRCIRGEVEIYLPTAPAAGVTGPIANVFGFIFGSWADTGFGGLKGQFKRRDLLKFAAADVSAGCFQFRHIPTGQWIEVKYDPSFANSEPAIAEPFQMQWRTKIRIILEQADRAVTIHRNLLAENTT